MSCEALASDRRWRLRSRVWVRRHWRPSRFAARPAPGALNRGESGVCAANVRWECVLKFRVSSDGRTLRFVKKGEAVSFWACRGGGAEAIFGGTRLTPPLEG